MAISVKVVSPAIASHERITAPEAEYDTQRHTGRTITYKQDQKICHPFNRQGSRTISRSLRRLFCLRWQDIGFDQGVAGGVPFATHDRGGIPGDDG